MAPKKGKSSKKKSAVATVVWVWACCYCGASGMTMLSETCSTCGTPRCQSCPVHKQPRWLGSFNTAFTCGLESLPQQHPALSNQPLTPTLDNKWDHWHSTSFPGTVTLGVKEPTHFPQSQSPKAVRTRSITPAPQLSPHPLLSILRGFQFEFIRCQLQFSSQFPLLSGYLQLTYIYPVLLPRL